jgi:hypothetical protein
MPQPELSIEQLVSCHLTPGLELELRHQAVSDAILRRTPQADVFADAIIAGLGKNSREPRFM